MSKKIWEGIGEPNDNYNLSKETDLAKFTSGRIAWDDGKDDPIVEPVKENKITTEEYNNIVRDGAISKDYTSNQYGLIKGLTFNLPHAEVMVRLFKADSASRGGILLPNVKMMPSPSGEKMVPVLDDNELADFMSRGVIVAVGEKCTMKDSITIGDIVDVKPIRNLGDHQFRFNKSKDSSFENYFIFPEVYIQMIWSSEATPNS